MRTIVEVVGDVLAQQPVKVTLMKDDHVIQELTPYGSDPAFHDAAATDCEAPSAPG